MLQLIHQVLLNIFTTWVQNSFVYCPIEFNTRILEIVSGFFCLILKKIKLDFPSMKEIDVLIPDSKS